MQKEVRPWETSPSGPSPRPPVSPSPRSRTPTTSPTSCPSEVRQRVLETAKALGYAGPNPAARSLRSQRARAIGLVFTERLSYAFSDPYSVGMLAGLAEVAEQFQTGLLLIPLRPFDPERPEEVEASTEAMRAAVVDGLLAYCLDIDHPAREIAVDRGLRMVATDDKDPRMDGLVLIDERGAARQIGEHIRRLGHRNVGIVVDSKVDSPAVVEVDDVQHRSMSFSWDRYDGFREGLGPDVTVHTVAPPGHNSVEAGRAAGAHLLDRQDRPPRSSPSATSWPSGCWTRCASAGSPPDGTSRCPASTTCPRRPTPA